MSNKSVSSLLVVICIAASVNAQLPQFPFPNPFQPSPGMPGLPNPFRPSPDGTPGMPAGTPGMPNIAKCWSTVMDLPGCIAEIRQAIVSGKFGIGNNIGPACCKAFLDAEANCTPNLPFKYPLFPPTIIQQCSKNAGPPTTLL